MRWGVLAALRRKHIDTSVGLVRVEVAVPLAYGPYVARLKIGWHAALGMRNWLGVLP